jgi:hypothetical protein
LRQAEQRRADPGQDQREPGRDVVGDAPLAYPTADVSDPEKSEGEGRRQRLDAYDWFVLAVAVLALSAAAAAAWFTWEQAAVARDQMRRSLRAYVVATAKLVRGSADPKGLLVQIDLENMGQTPVYDASVTAMAAAVGIMESRVPFNLVMRMDCGQYLAQPQVRSETFGKTYAAYAGMSPEGYGGSGQDLPALRRREKLLVVYGTACYRDIFGAAHAVRFCYRWFSEDGAPLRCPYQIEAAEVEAAE